MKKKYENKYISFFDRYPFIIVAIILIFAIITFLQIKAKYPLTFFSGATQNIIGNPYSIIVAYPVEGEVFDLENRKGYITIEIVSEEIEEINYELNLVINDKVIKTFSELPYTFDWYPSKSGRYIIIGELMDDSNKTISISDKVLIWVWFKSLEPVSLY